MKWAVIGIGVFEQRYKLLNDFINQSHPGAELEVVNCGIDDLPAMIPKLTKEYDQIRVDSPLSEAILKQFKSKSLVNYGLKAADCLVQRSGQWWTESALFQAFNGLLSKYGTQLDLRAEVLIVGAGAAARIAVASLFRAGFKTINIANVDDEQGVLLLKELERGYFGCKFTYVPANHLVMLPGSNILVINTTPLSTDNKLLDELYYLNFLKRDGMIWDLVLSPTITPLIREGQQIDVKCLRGCEIAVMVDQKWMEWVYGGTTDIAPLLAAYEQAFIL